MHAIPFRIKCVALRPEHLLTFVARRRFVLPLMTPACDAERTVVGGSFPGVGSEWMIAFLLILQFFFCRIPTITQQDMHEFPSNPISRNYHVWGLFRLTMPIFRSFNNFIMFRYSASVSDCRLFILNFSPSIVTISFHLNVDPLIIITLFCFSKSIVAHSLDKFYNLDTHNQVLSTHK